MEKSPWHRPPRLFSTVRHRTDKAPFHVSLESRQHSSPWSYRIFLGFVLCQEGCLVLTKLSSLKGFFRCLLSGSVPATSAERVFLLTWRNRDLFKPKWTLTFQSCGHQRWTSWPDNSKRKYKTKISIFFTFGKYFQVYLELLRTLAVSEGVCSWTGSFWLLASF